MVLHAVLYCIGQVSQSVRTIIRTAFILTKYKRRIHTGSGYTYTYALAVNKRPFEPHSRDEAFSDDEACMEVYAICNMQGSITIGSGRSWWHGGMVASAWLIVLLCRVGLHVPVRPGRESTIIRTAFSLLSFSSSKAWHGSVCKDQNWRPWVMLSWSQ
jgi:hypothetical protein